MKTMSLPVLCILSMFFITACSENKAPKEETLIDPQLKALEKAKDVEQVLQDAEEARQKQIEDQLR